MAILLVLSRFGEVCDAASKIVHPVFPERGQRFGRQMLRFYLDARGSGNSLEHSLATAIVSTNFEDRCASCACVKIGGIKRLQFASGQGRHTHYDINLDAIH